MTGNLALSAERAALLLKAIVDSSDDAIISKDLDGVITSWNESAERPFGYTEAEAVGRPVTILIPPDRLDEEPRILARIKKAERVDHVETVRRHKDGSPVNISLTISPVPDAGGEIVGASEIARDTTGMNSGDSRFRGTTVDVRWILGQR
jgi:PAS domain S-box-containing protein